MAHRALRTLVSIYAEGLVDAFAHATIVRASLRILHGDRPGHPSGLRREDDGFYWMWKEGFTGVAVCKGLRKRNVTNRCYVIAVRSELVEIRRDYSTLRSDLSSR